MQMHEMCERFLLYVSGARFKIDGRLRSFPADYEFELMHYPPISDKSSVNVLPRGKGLTEWQLMT